MDEVLTEPGFLDEEGLRQIGVIIRKGDSEGEGGVDSESEGVVHDVDSEKGGWIGFKNVLTWKKWVLTVIRGLKNTGRVEDLYSILRCQNLARIAYNDQIPK